MTSVTMTTNAVGPRDLVIDDAGLDEVDRLITVCGLADGLVRGDHQQLRAWSGFEPISTKVNFAELYAWPDIRLEALSEPLDCRWSVPVIEQEEGASERVALVRVREAKPPKRLHLPQVGRTVEVAICSLDIGTEDFQSRSRWFTTASTKLLRLGGRREAPTEYSQRLFRFGMNLQFDRRYRWSVLLGYDSGPLVRLATDSIGAHEAIRLRDIEAGKARRSALLHWVRGHYRRARTEQAPIAWVREHVRGATKFSMNGFRCEIEMSPFDRERLRSG